MFIELPLAVVTVRFDEQPITGMQLAALVKQIAEQGNHRFVVQHKYYDGDIISIGQMSYFPHNRIRVVPELTGFDFFSPVGDYREVKVTNHLWGKPVESSSNDEKIIATVKQFAADLKAAYESALVNGFPEYVES